MADLNRRTRFCRPLPNHSANEPLLTRLRLQRYNNFLTNQILPRLKLGLTHYDLTETVRANEQEDTIRAWLHIGTRRSCGIDVSGGCRNRGASLEEVFEIAPAIKVSCFAEFAIVYSVHKV